MPGNKRLYVLKQTYNEKLIENISMHDPLLPPSIKVLKYFV